MFAGTTVGNNSGNLLGVHQRIDRVARRHLKTLIGSSYFPDIKDILKFEGNNGPDGVKRKSPSLDEPWHYIDPKKPHDVSLIQIINDHQANLAAALYEKNHERASFEAAWLAHAIVDGLTPAHHYPLGDKIEELFGKPHYERLTVKEKNLIKGDNRRDTVSKNWEYWGGGGIFSNHVMFEFGIMTLILGQSFPVTITDDDVAKLKEVGFEAMFHEMLHAIVDMQTYELYMKHGWDWRLSKTVRHDLVPLIMKAVCLGWYAATLDSEKIS